MPLRAEILQNLSKIKQNLSPKNKSITQVFVRFCLDSVGFLAEGDPKNPSKVKSYNIEETSSIGGKVTAERPVDDGGKDVSNVWNDHK